MFNNAGLGAATITTWTRDRITAAATTTNAKLHTTSIQTQTHTSAHLK